MTLLKNFIELKKKAILFGIPPTAHVSLAMDEVAALEGRGYVCNTITYGRNDQTGTGLKKVWITIKNAVRVSRKIKKVKPEFLYLNSRFEPVGSLRDFITVIILKLLNRQVPKIIIKTHGSDLSILSGGSRLYKKVIIPFLVGNVYRWLFLSNEEKYEIERLHPAMGKRVRVIPNIIVPERCVPSADFLTKYSLPEEKFICLFAGRLVEVKGVFDIVKSFAFLKAPDKFHFIFVGNGKDKERLQQEAAPYLRDVTASFIGFIPDTECDQFYAVSDVLIYPTFDSEGFPMALFKSVACGMPVITTRLRAAKDYLNEPANVIWVSPQSPMEIADALEKLYSDYNLREQIRRNNSELGKKFSYQEVGRLLDGIFNEGELEVAG